MTNPTNLWMECKFRFDSSEKIMGHSKLITVCIFLMILIACAESRLRCYNCTYVEYKKKETWAGLEECQAKKFDDEKIPVITCDGTCVVRLFVFPLVLSDTFRLGRCGSYSANLPPK
ncbi:uncharacterized protein LOC110987343 isoform X2 [Acanthaster planci]|uniref:Uncharacterized protein LOC110987343 isoform X2 n=1 Tax=Acanthaster planci TaxID=133434 RepID=A0A8B7ZQI8_ACAPL|nr:uncharacterized protein LOC110987343 isoform X2 [Acanthaster planci]